MSSAEKLSRFFYPLGWIFGYPLYLKSYPAIPIDLSGCDLLIYTDSMGPWPSGIFEFLCIYFYMWTSNIISHTTQCSLLSSYILVCKKSKKKKMLNTIESFHFPDQAVCIVGRRDQMASRLKSAESQLGCMRGHFLPQFPGSLVRAGPGALSRTRGINVRTSVWLAGP